MFQKIEEKSKFLQSRDQQKARFELINHGEIVGGDEGSTTHSKRRPVDIAASSSEINDVEDEEDDECEADGNREDESLVKFEFLRGFNRVRVVGRWNVSFWNWVLVWVAVRHFKIPKKKN